MATLEDAVAGWNKTDNKVHKLFIQTVSFRNMAFLVRNGYSQVPVLLTTKTDILEKKEKADIWDILKKTPVKGCGFAEENCEEP